MAFAFWAVVGLFLDGWAHSEKKPDSFFTPWHGVLYSGFSLAAAWTLFTIWRRRSEGRPLLATAPAGQTLTLAGFTIFGAGAVGDLVWHEIFGIEVSVEALLSPTHLLLLSGGLLALSSPLRVAWTMGGDTASLRSFLAPLLSLSLITAIVAFFFVYLSPFESGDAAAYAPANTDIHELSRLTPAVAAQLRERWGLASFLVTTLVLVFPVLLVLRRWRPPIGTFTFLFTVVIGFEVAMGEFRQLPLVLTGAVAGAVADVLARRRAPIPLVGALTPISLWLGYFVIFGAFYGLGWSPELWLGITMMTGLVGLSLALLVAPVGTVEESGAESLPA